MDTGGQSGQLTAAITDEIHDEDASLRVSVSESYRTGIAAAYLNS